MANIIPKDTHDIVAKFLSGDVKGSRDLQLGVLNLVKALFVEVSPIPVKAAMNLIGMSVGKCRMPLVDPSEKSIDMIKGALKEYGLLS